MITALLAMYLHALVIRPMLMIFMFQIKIFRNLDEGGGSSLSQEYIKEGEYPTPMLIIMW